MTRNRDLLTKDTLRKICSEFPTHDWSDQDLDELVAPSFGVITGFQKMIEDIQALVETDLDAIEPAGEGSYDRE